VIQIRFLTVYIDSHSELFRSAVAGEGAVRKVRDLWEPNFTTSGPSHRERARKGYSFKNLLLPITSFQRLKSTPLENICESAYTKCLKSLFCPKLYKRDLARLMDGLEGGN